MKTHSGEIRFFKGKQILALNVPLCEASSQNVPVSLPTSQQAQALGHNSSQVISVHLFFRQHYSSIFRMLFMGLGWMLMRFLTVK